MTYPQYRPQPGTVPAEPGVYRFRDADGRVIYVGKAVNLRSRLANYFTGFVEMHPRTQAMVTSAESVDWTVVSNEVEALQLEYAWIQEYQPRFNIKYRDDKSYPLLAVTVNEQFPRVHVYRGARKRARLGHPGNRRLDAAGVPNSHLLRRGLSSGGRFGAALPARLHRQVQRPLCGPG